MEIRGRSYSSSSALKSSLSCMVLEGYQMCRPESRVSSRTPFTEPKDTDIFALCSTSPIVHSLSENGVEDTQRSSTSLRNGQDIDGNDRRISGYRLGPQGDCARKPKASFKDISKTGYKSDHDPKHEEPDNTRINTSAEEVSTLALQKFDEIFDGCDAEKRFNSDPKRCLLNTKKGQRCGRLICWEHEDMIREVLASLANLSFDVNEQECIRQLERLADLAICKRNHRGKAKTLIANLHHDHAASIVGSVMEGTDLFQAGASGWGSSTMEIIDKSSVTLFKKQDVMPGDARKEIQAYARGRHANVRLRYTFRTTRSTLKKKTNKLPRFLPYRPREATKSSTTEWLKKQISKPLLRSELASGWLYVYWNRASFGFVKIGFTTVDVDGRLKRWIQQCKHEAELHACSDGRIPHVRRLEQIVHAEFKEFRYCERNCHGCHRNHIEWFQLPSDSIRKTVIDKWIRWMSTEPYEEIQGVWQLKPQHAENLDELGNTLQVRETQEVNKQLETAAVTMLKRIRTWEPFRGENGRLRAKSKIRQINRLLN